jgi:hypothetical protein
MRDFLRDIIRGLMNRPPRSFPLSVEPFAFFFGCDCFGFALCVHCLALRLAEMSKARLANIDRPRMIEPS